MRLPSSSVDITNIIFNYDNTNKLQHSMYFSVFHNSIDNYLYVYSDLEENKCILIDKLAISVLPNNTIAQPNINDNLYLEITDKNNEIIQFKSNTVMKGNDIVFDTQNVDNSGIIYDKNFSNTTRKNILNNAGIVAKTYMEAKLDKFYLYVNIINTNESIYGDFLVFNQLIATNGPCIHPDMVIDIMGAKISNVIGLPPNTGYKTNLKMGYATRFVKIAEDAFGNHLPSNDLLLTPRHPIMYCNEELPVEKLVGIVHNVEYIDLLEPVMVYALAFDTRKTIKIHGIDVWQWDINDFKKFCEKHNYVYNNCLFVDKAP